ncbi:MAG: hypothetical protein NTU44_08975, partial [Bacteroidetes bacterium]|nr:hypothetical protein [Bacteroidota bacterium]
MNNKIRSLLIIALLCLILNVNGQTGQSTVPKDRSSTGLTKDTNHNPLEAKLFLIGKVYKDSIVLRWGPDKAKAWRLGNEYGYRVERMEIQRDKKAYTEPYKRLVTGPIKPWLSEEWAKKSAKDNKYAAVAYQALYGKSFAPSLAPDHVSNIKN